MSARHGIAPAPRVEGGGSDCPQVSVRGIGRRSRAVPHRTLATNVGHGPLIAFTFALQSALGQSPEASHSATNSRSTVRELACREWVPRTLGPAAKRDLSARRGDRFGLAARARHRGGEFSAHGPAGGLTHIQQTFRSARSRGSHCLPRHRANQRRRPRGRQIQKRPRTEVRGRPVGRYRPDRIRTSRRSRRSTHDR